MKQVYMPLKIIQETLSKYIRMYNKKRLWCYVSSLNDEDWDEDVHDEYDDDDDDDDEMMFMRRENDMQSNVEIFVYDQILFDKLNVGILSQFTEKKKKKMFISGKWIFTM